MYCHQCGTQLPAEANYCAKCGTKTVSSPQPSATPTPSNAILATQTVQPRHEVPFEQSNGFFGKLIRGDYGLPRTYWLYGMVVAVAANIVGALLSPFPKLLLFLSLALLPYDVIWIIGLWRAATRYVGPTVWAVLAKIVCVIGSLMTVVGVVVGIKLVVADLPNPSITTSEETARGLQWEESDNGGDINWNDAKAYCASMGNGWRLPTVPELKSSYQSGQSTPCGQFTCKVASNSRLTGPWFWSNEPKDSSKVWFVTLTYGLVGEDDGENRIGKRALCVRPR